MSLMVAVVFATSANAQSYCPSDGGSGNVFNLQRVQFAGIDNSSGDNNGYADFTSISASVQAGDPYSITLDAAGIFFLPKRFRAYIDWDQNGVFSASELVFQANGFGQQSGTIVVPVGASLGSTRLRVNTSSLTYQGACANYSLGEVEDYTVMVMGQCQASAGALQPVKPLICYTGIEAFIQATVTAQPVVPSGYQVIYVLTQGPGLVIQNVSADPQFSVGVGNYTIHTLIYDPNTLDLSIVELGVTTGFDVNGLLIQGGGAICAALDVAGAQFSVTDPSAGTLSGGADVCGTDSATTLTATANGDANVPAGYSTVYVLT
ncbi:MAG: hypothetical protein KA175_02445, partial [Flavobacteriales bacterium]|nr:hypothetical protein [Flavobacteriales bacterium]